MPPGQRSVSLDPARGYLRLDPVPTDEELAEFYGTEYYESAGDGRAPDLKSLTADDERTIRERSWRNATIYPDVLSLVTELGVAGGDAIDIGCGTGEFVAYLDDEPGGDWKAIGTELSVAAVERARSRGLEVMRCQSGELDATYEARFDLVTMFNVLEHVPHPESVLADGFRLLRSGGVVVIQVPNDFSLLQEATRVAIDADPWWVAVPDHINYFTFDTLAATLSAAGFVSQRRFCTFPMEFFLISGLDYVTDPVAGAASHRRRCEFELALDPPVRRALYERFAAAGLGRNCVIAAIKP